MTQYVCDRCAAIHEKPLEGLNIPGNKDPRNWRNDREASSVDLCPSCIIILHEWIKPLPLKQTTT